MHNKFIVRDRSAVWTGSLNFTDDAFTLMENNVVEIESPQLAQLLLVRLRGTVGETELREHRPDRDASGAAHIRGAAGDRRA